jgi:hypothetical protein
MNGRAISANGSLKANQSAKSVRSPISRISRRFIGGWTRTPTFATSTRARAEQADKLFREIIEIADDASDDYVTTSDGKRIVDHENIQRSRLRVDARKWAAARLAPKKYGDRVEHDVKGGDFQPAILIQIGGGGEPEPVEVSGKVIEEE